MINPLWKKTIKSPLMVLFVALVTLFLFSSFAKRDAPRLTPEEKTWMESFFRGVMLQHNAIYTLYGSKPMTMIAIEEEEMQNSKEMKNRIVTEDYHLLQNWENWEKTRSRFQLNRYLFFKRIDSTDPKRATIYFADMTKIALVLQENYNLFKRETGLDFDPLKESLKIEQGSEFWNKTFDQPALLGILLGYGIKNSLCFQWKYCNLPESTHEKLAESLVFQFSDKPLGGKATFDKLTIPIFASFSEAEDEVIEKYKKEREVIRGIYEDRDFLTLTLQKLTAVDQ